MLTFEVGMNEYREWSPPPDLAPWIECYWTRIDDAGSAGTTVLPDGCTDLLLDRATGAAILVGTMTLPLLVEPEARDMIAVRFNPGAATSFFSYPALELVDRVIPTGELRGVPIIVPDPLEPQARSLERLTAQLRRRKDDHAGSDRARVAATLMQSRSVSVTARLLGLSRQHLRRLVRDHVGITPKRLSRILRFRRACSALKAERDGIADVAAALGYSDQSHMNRDLCEFGGAPASRLIG